MLTPGVSIFVLGASAHLLAAQTPTFYRDVLPVLQAHCQECHRPGEAAPMSFLTYREVRPWAKAIRSAVLTQKMPPWFADPCCGKFANDRSLSASERDTLARWADAGAPEGDAKQAPPARVWLQGWNLPSSPDAVFGMPKPFTVPAKEAVDYQYSIVPTGFTEDRWVTAAGQNCCAGRAQDRTRGLVSPGYAATTNDTSDTDDGTERAARAVRG